MPSDAREPVRPAADFWQRPDVVAALSTRDVGALFRLLRQYAGESKTRTGIPVGIPKGAVRRVMRRGPGQGRVPTHAVLMRIADGLDMPQQARRIFGLADHHAGR